MGWSLLATYSLSLSQLHASTRIPYPLGALGTHTHTNTHSVKVAVAALAAVRAVAVTLLLTRFAPRVVLRSTHENTLEHCDLADLEAFAVDLDEVQADEARVDAMREQLMKTAGLS